MSFTRLRYHIVTGTRFREGWLIDAVERAVYASIRQTAITLGVRCIAMGGIQDHVHLILAIPPTLSISEVVRDLKKYSTRAANNVIHPSQCFAWQDGYSAFTLHAFDYEAAVAYVHRQKEHHANYTLIDYYERWQEETE